MNSTVAVGDVNGDEQINNTDVQTILDYLVGLNPEPFYPGGADINSDGAIDLKDALSLAQQN